MYAWLRLPSTGSFQMPQKWDLDCELLQLLLFFQDLWMILIQYGVRCLRYLLSVAFVELNGCIFFLLLCLNPHFFSITCAGIEHFNEGMVFALDAIPKACNCLCIIRSSWTTIRSAFVLINYIHGLNLEQFLWCSQNMENYRQYFVPSVRVLNMPRLTTSSNKHMSTSSFEFLLNKNKCQIKHKNTTSIRPTTKFKVTGSKNTSRKTGSSKIAVRPSKAASIGSSKKTSNRGKVASKCEYKSRTSVMIKNRNGYAKYEKQEKFTQVKYGRKTSGKGKGKKWLNLGFVSPLVWILNDRIMLYMFRCRVLLVV